MKFFKNILVSLFFLSGVLVRAYPLVFPKKTALAYLQEVKEQSKAMYPYGFEIDREGEVYKIFEELAQRILPADKFEELTKRDCLLYNVDLLGTDTLGYVKTFEQEWHVRLRPLSKEEANNFGVWRLTIGHELTHVKYDYVGQGRSDTLTRRLYHIFGEVGLWEKFLSRRIEERADAGGLEALHCKLCLLTVASKNCTHYQEKKSFKELAKEFFSGGGTHPHPRIAGLKAYKMFFEEGRLCSCHKDASGHMVLSLVGLFYTFCSRDLYFYVNELSRRGSIKILDSNSPIQVDDTMMSLMTRYVEYQLRRHRTDRESYDELEKELGRKPLHGWSLPLI